MSTQAKSQKTKQGYYGDLTFLDNQEEFNITFGISPTILPSDPTSTDYLSTRKTHSRLRGKIEIRYFYVP